MKAILFFLLAVGLFSAQAAENPNKVTNLKPLNTGDIVSSGYLSLSGRSNRVTISGDALLLDGAAITGGGGESLWTASSNVMGNAISTVTDELALMYVNFSTNIGDFKLQYRETDGELESFFVAHYQGSVTLNGVSSGFNINHPDTSFTGISSHGMDTYDSTGTNGIVLDNGDLGYFNRPAIAITVNGGSAFVTKLDPKTSNVTTPYVFNTSLTHASGNLLEIKNNGTNVASVGYDGSITVAGTTSIAPNAADGTTPHIFGTSVEHTSGNLVEVNNNGIKAAISAAPTAGQTALYLWDPDNATLQQVTLGDADSGGSGFRALRIPNAP